MDSSGLVIILIVLVMLSAFFSASETAFTSLNRVRIKLLADDGDSRAKKTLLIFDNYEITITTLLICNNLVNIAAASVGTVLVFHVLPSISEDVVAVISTMFITILVLIFGEVLPKNFARVKADTFALTISWLIYVMIKCLKPISIPILFLNRSVKKIYHDGISESSVTEEELKAYIDAIEEEGILEEAEGELVRSVLDFDETTIGEILTPRTNIVGIDVQTSERDLLEIILSEKYSRLPLYDDSLDNIIGLIYERDILVHLVKKKKLELREIMRPAYFVPKSMKASSLLKYLQERNSHLAIVIDEFGGTCGLITMEDLLEEIVGEIWDEHDEVIEKIIEKGDYFIISHDQSISDFFDKYIENESPPETEYTGFGGWIYELLEVIPAEGDTVTYDGNTVTIEMKVIGVEANRIEKVKVTVKEKEIDESEYKI